MSNSYFQGVVQDFRAKYSEALKEKSPDNYTRVKKQPRETVRRFAKSPWKSKIGGGISGKIHPQDYQKQS
jgi:hypothetical protein